MAMGALILVKLYPSMYLHPFVALPSFFGNILAFLSFLSNCLLMQASNNGSLEPLVKDSFFVQI